MRILQLFWLIKKTDYACRIAYYQGMWRDVFGYDGTGTDHCSLTDSYTAEDSSICSNRGTLPDKSRTEFKWLLTARKEVIGEGGIWTDHHVIFKPETVPDLHSALDRDPVADYDIVFYEDMIADIAIGTNLSTWENMRKGPDSCIITNVVRFNE
jgi:hypothetical protein